jgi:hypothetical protein
MVARRVMDCQYFNHMMGNFMHNRSPGHDHGREDLVFTASRERS